MNSKQLYWTLLGSCGLLTLALLASVYLGTSILQDSSTKLQEAKVEREVVDAQELSLMQAKSDIEEYSELEELSRRIIPQEKDQARTVRELISIARQSGVNISAISFPSSDLGAQEAATEGGGGDSIITQAEPVSGMPGLYELEISVQVSQHVSYPQLISFLENLEQNRRTSQVNSVSISPDSNNRDNVTFNISLSVFLKP